jgi:hypothetical protein
LTAYGIPHRFESFTGNHTNHLLQRGVIGLMFLDSVMHLPEEAPQTPAPVPQALALGQNFPNPFNSSTTIEFTLSHGGNVSLAVFDVLGREVAALALGQRAPGQHQVNFSAAGLAGGVYFYRLQSGKELSAPRKMLYLK